MSDLLRRAARAWLLPTLVALLALGVIVGMTLGPESQTVISRWINPSWTTVVVIFLMSFTLDGRALWRAAFTRPGPALWGSFVNLGLGPAVAWGLSFWQRSDDFRLGLLIAGSVPCTLATASVWTRRAGGDDAVSLVVTLITNLLCVVATPAWLHWTTGHDVPFDAAALGRKLFVSAVLPTVLGQLARLIPLGAELATRRHRPLSWIAQGLVLLIVFVAATEAGARVAATGHAPGVGALAVAWISCAAAHVALLAVAMLGGAGLGFERPALIAAAFAGSQKTLPIGLLIATDPALFAGPDALGPGRSAPFVIFPMILFHVSQLVIDAAVAARWARANVASSMGSPSDA